MARTADEREAIYRLRYRVFAEELRRSGYRGIDHRRRWIREDGDEADNTTHYYIGEPGRIRGAVRVRHWAAGELDRSVVQQNSLDLLPLAGCVCISLDLVAVDPSARTGLPLANLAIQIIEDSTTIRGIHVAVMDCVPALARFWMAIGFRPYGGRLIEKDDVVTIPLIGLPSDLEHLRRIRSPWFPALSRACRAGRLPHLDLEPFHHAFASQSGVIHEPRRVRQAVATALGGSLDSARCDDLAAGGLVLEIPAGARVVHRGTLQREIYLVLSGRFEATEDGGVVAAAQPGDLFGHHDVEGREPQRRDVRAVVASRVLALSARAMTRILARASDRTPVGPTPLRADAPPADLQATALLASHAVGPAGARMLTRRLGAAP